MVREEQHDIPTNHVWFCTAIDLSHGLRRFTVCGRDREDAYHAALVWAEHTDNEDIRRDTVRVLRELPENFGNLNDHTDAESAAVTEV